MKKKIEFTAQGEHSECGLAATNMILNFYRNNSSNLMSLRSEYGVPRGGLTVKNIHSIMTDKGLNCKAFKIPTDTDFSSIPIPSIAYWNENHYIVIEKIRQKRILINDPARSKAWITFEEFKDHFSSIILYAEPNIDFLKNTNLKKSVWEFLYSFVFKNFKKDMFKIFFSAFILQLSLITLPIFSKVIIDNILLFKNKTLLFSASVAVFFAFIIIYIVQRQKNILVSNFQKKFDQIIMSEYISKLFYMPLNYFENRSSGELVFRSNMNVYIRQVVSQRAISLLIDSVFLIFYLALMVYYSLILTLVTVIITILIITTIIFNSSAVQKYVEQETNIQGKAQKIISESVKSIETIKSTHTEKNFFYNWEKNFTEQINITLKKDLFIAKLGILPDIIQNFLPIILVLVSVPLFINHNLTLGTLIAFSTLVSMFIRPITNLASIYNDMLMLKVYLNKLMEVFESDIKKNNAVYLSSKNSELLRLDKISFKPSIFEENIIDNISFNIQSGEKIALVGKSGSGKSTILKIISGLIIPTEGKLIMNNQNIKNNDIFFVNQQADIFNESIEKNITLTSDINKNKLNYAASMSGTYDIVKNSPMGLETLSSEGGKNFSGGQRQKISIARALYSNNSLLLLDEPTSAMDNISESDIFKSLLQNDNTVITVAHRLKTITNFDRIVVVENGKIVGNGNHMTLLKNCQEYKKLYSEETGQLTNE